jgi:ABC-type transport system substrate-binding protein
MKVRDPELDRLTLAAIGEADFQKANPLYTQMQRIIYEKSYFVPGIVLASFSLQQPWVYDFLHTYSVQAEILAYNRVWMDVDQLPAKRR